MNDPLSAAERVVLRQAIEPPGFVSERELLPSQTRVARDLQRRQLLKLAGTEPDGTKVYTATALGRKGYGA